MKHSSKTLLGISAALAIAIATGSTVYAQGTNQQATQGTMMGNTTSMMHGQNANMGDRSSRMGGQNGMMGGHGNMMQMMNMMMGGRGYLVGRMGMMGNSKAYIDKRLANTKKILGITRNQLPAWNAYTKAIQSQADFMITRMQRMRNGQFPNVDRRAAMMDSWAGQMQKTAAAAKNLYKKLTPAQRIKANRWLPIPGSHY